MQRNPSVAPALLLDRMLRDADQLEQLVALDRFEQKELNTNFERAFHQRLVVFSGNHDNDGRHVYARDTNMTSEFETVRGRHAHVKEDGVEFLVGEALGGLGAAGEGANLEPRGAQEFSDKLTGNRVIVYNKNLSTQLGTSREARERRMATDDGKESRSLP